MHFLLTHENTIYPHMEENSLHTCHLYRPLASWQTNTARWLLNDSVTISVDMYRSALLFLSCASFKHDCISGVDCLSVESAVTTLPHWGNFAVLCNHLYGHNRSFTTRWSSEKSSSLYSKSGYHHALQIMRYIRVYQLKLAVYRYTVLLTALVATQYSPKWRVHRTVDANKTVGSLGNGYVGFSTLNVPSRILRVPSSESRTAYFPELHRLGLQSDCILIDNSKSQGTFSDMMALRFRDAATMVERP